MSCISLFTYFLSCLYNTYVCVHTVVVHVYVHYVHEYTYTHVHVCMYVCMYDNMNIMMYLRSIIVWVFV